MLKMPSLSIIDSLINFFQIQRLNLNFLDIVILIVLLFYSFEGYSLGFVAAFLDFVSFILSFALGLKTYVIPAGILVRNFSVPAGFANAFGFFIAAFVIEIILGFFMRYFYKLIVPAKDKKEVKKASIFGKANNILGIIPGFASALVLMSFILTIIISLPFSPFLKHMVFSSRIGSQLVANTSGFEKKINDVFGGAVSETLNFLTVKPQSNDFIKLNFKTKDFKEDVKAENDMLVLVNKERTSRGLSVLTMDDDLKKVARSHSEDMFARGYFSHYTPESLSPFDRLAQADITYLYAGENLALAPNVELAMQGFMNSEGHKANILSPNFGKIGIGVIDGGIYGEMFSQEFTN
ncbi:MAG: CvpA family protein [Candidatus Levybacteria bacterium]|nr:CvpA family protein [Candidatus Levybacteria bacterium]